ncbi:Flagellar biosynthetic protein FliQ [Botrimarina colliarenosi]|uniref:Flagellar biosynthetic protein FliQ n=1 Tax=Botrimarina colliarenosi TaxID=2528001 RepID=A0A5C6ALH9_9BACT|nr:flagellar biosynthesis protein FliQ [Botrimarina colliarenosi]TWU00317.1 Flagellar biosynthetic protein FliQ [Botrimarina colliarenosi]
MDPQLAIDISRDALFMTSVIAAPVLIAGVVVGLVIGLLQALTQIQEQTVAFVPKLVAMGLALAITLPWILAQLMDYSENLFREIPSTL